MLPLRGVVQRRDDFVIGVDGQMVKAGMLRIVDALVAPGGEDDTENGQQQQQPHSDERERASAPGKGAVRRLYSGTILSQNRPVMAAA